jgi:hypothetical protein
VASGALAARVADVQVILIPVSVVSLAVAHYRAHRKGTGGRGQQALWLATAGSVALWVLPHLIR